MCDDETVDKHCPPDWSVRQLQILKAAIITRYRMNDGLVRECLHWTKGLKMINLIKGFPALRPEFATN